jgi:molybdopterin synthase catalytic subunit
MQVRVLFFGLLRDLAGRQVELVELPSGATVADLLNRFGETVPRFAGLLSAVAVSVNQEYAARSVELHNGDEVALLPPVSGGSEFVPGRPRAHIVREPIQTAYLANSLKLGSDGAVLVFEGIVRDNSRGRATLYLDYEAYEPMALKQMEALIAEALEMFGIREAVIVHRLGRLQIGEASVAIIVVSAHRAAAFEACRWLIDRLKRLVPIWKKEYFEDGAVWADGEPFPEAIRK